jgi:hypothetical protein
MAGDADDPVGPDRAPRLGVRCVLLADMDAVAAEARGVPLILNDRPDLAARSGRSLRISGTPRGRSNGCIARAAASIASSGTSFSRSCTAPTSPPASASARARPNVARSSIAGGVIR